MTPWNTNDGLTKWRKARKEASSVSDGCGFVYILPTILVCFPNVWTIGLIVVSIVLGLILSKPIRRCIAILSLLCLLCPEGSIKVAGWFGGWWLTYRLDRRAKRESPVPTSEWD